MLFTHFGRKAIIIVDEYDVPLDKAFQNGYYNEMVSLIRGIFGMALKTNEFLQFAVLTGCLRISKESIFTGLNNFRVMSITDARFDEQFGFTDNEVRKLLEDYNMSMHYNDIKEWYDGYHFGKADVYCPWDVINYVDTLRADPLAEPKNYWSNTSSNEAVKRFILSAYKIKSNSSFFIKGSWYKVKDLVTDEKQAKKFAGGDCVVLRLCANDYHHYCYIGNATYKGQQVTVTVQFQIEGDCEGYQPGYVGLNDVGQNSESATEFMLTVCGRSINELKYGR